jgi:hypothetical protein
MEVAFRGNVRHGSRISVKYSKWKGHINELFGMEVAESSYLLRGMINHACIMINSIGNG